MALVKCPECGKEVSDQAKNCPNCGFAVENHLNELKKKTMVIIFNWHSVDVIVKDENNNNFLKLASYKTRLCLLNYPSKKIIVERDECKAESDISRGEKNFFELNGEIPFFGNRCKSLSLTRVSQPYNEKGPYLFFDCSTKKLEERKVNTLEQ